MPFTHFPSPVAKSADRDVIHGSTFVGERLHVDQHRRRVVAARLEIDEQERIVLGLVHEVRVDRSGGVHRQRHLLDDRRIVVPRRRGRQTGRRQNLRREEHDCCSLLHTVVSLVIYTRTAKCLRKPAERHTVPDCAQLYIILPKWGNVFCVVILMRKSCGIQHAPERGM